MGGARGYAAKKIGTGISAPSLLSASCSAEHVLLTASSEDCQYPLAFCDFSADHWSYLRTTINGARARYGAALDRFDQVIVVTRHAIDSAQADRRCSKIAVNQRVQVSCPKSTRVSDSSMASRPSPTQKSHIV
jgi:hypothetical protein